MNNGKSALDQFLGNVGNLVGGAVQGVGNFFNQNVATPIERFAGQAQQSLNQIPQTFVRPTPQTPSFPNQTQLDISMQNQKRNRPIDVQQLQQQMNAQTATNPLMSIRQYMDSPQGQQLVQNNMGLFQALATIQNMGGQIPKVDFQQHVPQGMPAPVDFLARLGVGIPESIINVPHDIWAGGTQLGSDLATGAINKPQTALADAAQVGLPLLTILSFGGAGSLLESLGAQTSKSLGGKVLSGALRAAPVGTLFGEMAGLEQGRNAPDVQSQLMGALPYAGMGTLGGMIIGGIFGPVSQYFFGGAPGRAAVLAERGAIPEDVVNIARATLGVKPGATEAEVRTAYMNAMKKVHPDVGGDNAAATVVNNAYEILAKTKAPTDVAVAQDGNMNAKYHTTQDNPPMTADIVNSLTIAYKKANELFTPETFGKPTLPASVDGGLVSPNNLMTQKGMQVGITSAQPANPDPIITQLMNEGNKLFDSGDIDNGFNTLQKVTELTKNDLQTLLENNGVQINSLNTRTHGLYFSNPEPSFWLNVNKVNEDQAVASTAIFAQKHAQESFITAIKDEQGTPGVMVAFNRPLTNPEVIAIENLANTAGIGLTLDQDTGMAVGYNVKDFDSMTPDEFVTSVEKMLASLGQNGYKFASSVDNYQVKVYNKDNYGKVIQEFISKNPGAQQALQPTSEGPQSTGVTNLVQEKASGKIPVKTISQNEGKVNLKSVKTGQIFDINGQLLEVTKKPIYNKAGQMTVQLTNLNTKESIYITENDLNTLLEAANPDQLDIAINIPKTTTGTIDTVALVRELRDSGFTPEEIQAIKSDLAATEALKQSMQEEAKVKETEVKSEPKVKTPVKNPELVPTTQVVPAPSAELAPIENKVPVTSIKTPEETKISIARKKAAEKAADKVEPKPEEKLPPIAPPPTSEPPAIKTLQEYDPNNALTGYFKLAADNLLQDKGSFKTGATTIKRELVRLEEKREINGEKLSELVHDDIVKALPDLVSREKVQYALGDPTEVAGLTPEEKAVYTQLNIINTIIKDIKVARDPDFNPVEDYSTLYVPESPLVKNPLKLKKHYKSPLSTKVPENVDRNVKSFIPKEGGDTITGTPEQLKLKQSGEDKNIFENKDGLIYTARQATQREGEAAGINYEKDVAKTFERNFKNSWTFKTRTDFLENLKSGEFDADISLAPKPGWSKTFIKGLEGIYVSPQMEKTLSSFEINNEPSNVLSAGYNEFVNATRGLIFYNGIKHNLNMFTDALIGAGRSGPLGAPKLLTKLLPIFYDMVLHPTPSSMQKFLDVQNKGIGLDEFGRQAYMPGIFQRTASKIISNPEIVKMFGIADTLNPLHQLYRISSLMTRAGDNTLRIALHDVLKESNYSDAEISQIVNRWLVDYGNTGAFEKNVVNRVILFYPWMKGETGMYAEMAAHPKQNFWPMVNFVILMAIFGTAVNALKDFTGNKDAAIAAPGILGIAGDVMEIPEQLSKGEPPNVLVSHLQIPIKEGISQLTNKKRVNDIFKINGKPITDETTKYSAESIPDRLAHAAKGLIAPWSGVEPLATGNKTPAEFLANQLSIYTPHLKGFQAAPSGNLDFLGYNTSNDKPSTGMDIIHASNEVNKMLSNQDKLDWQKVKDLRQQGFKENSSDAYGLANTMMINNPKLYDAYAITAQAAAKAKGMQVDPMYDPKNKDVALQYLSYQNMNQEQQAAFVQRNQDIIQLQREINTYKASNDYAKNRNDIAQAMGEPMPMPFVPNPIYNNQPGTNVPIFSNQQLSEYQVYQAMPDAISLSDQANTNKAIYLANHPAVELVKIAQIPYYQAVLQNKWDNRPTGQTPASFIASQTKNGYLPNMIGVNPDGKIIPSYDQMADPKIKLWMAHPEQGALLNIYYAGLNTKNYPIANAAMASLQQLGFNYAQFKADKAQYRKDNPYSATLGTGDTGGLGIDFGSGASSGSGSGGGGYSSGGTGATTGMWNVVNDTGNIRVPIKFKDHTTFSNAIFKASPGVDWSKTLVALKKGTPKMDDFKFQDNKITIKDRRPSSAVTLKNSLGRIT